VSEYVLDASALLALLNAEKGANFVLGLLPDAVISTVNLAEVVTRLSAVDMPEHEIRDTLTRTTAATAVTADWAWDDLDIGVGILREAWRDFSAVAWPERVEGKSATVSEKSGLPRALAAPS
jgi:uncharacterized protein with PIN domain